MLHNMMLTPLLEAVAAWAVRKRGGEMPHLLAAYPGSDADAPGGRQGEVH